MDSHTPSAQRVQRLEIVETGRRRRWSEDEKLRIVLESLAGPRLVSATARRHGLARSQLLTWRRAFAASRSAPAAPSFVPALVVSEPAPASARASCGPGSLGSGRIEIVLGKGRRVIVDAGVEAEVLSRVLDVLERR